MPSGETQKRRNAETQKCRNAKRQVSQDTQGSAVASLWRTRGGGLLFNGFPAAELLSWVVDAGAFGGCDGPLGGSADHRVPSPAGPETAALHRDRPIASLCKRHLGGPLRRGRRKEEQVMPRLMSVRIHVIMLAGAVVATITAQAQVGRYVPDQAVGVGVATRLDRAIAGRARIGLGPVPDRSPRLPAGGGGPAATAGTRLCVRVVPLPYRPPATRPSAGGASDTRIRPAGQNDPLLL